MEDKRSPVGTLWHLIMSNDPENPGPVQFHPNRGDNNIEHESPDDKEEVHGIHHVTHAIHQVKEYISDSNTAFIDNRKVHHLEGHNPKVLKERLKEKKKQIPPLRV
mmetsp:Transcript_21129/g.26775  ORF Transcript_21129/g.26775 Transcript_21129/m.26775 type:complete len:106 (-) Transcript_21129:1259-1576(-)